MTRHDLGIDVGSTTVKLVVLGDDGALLARRYERAAGQPRRLVLREIEDVAAELGLDAVSGVALTGSGGAAVAAILGAPAVNELVAQTRAVGWLHPDTRTVVEIGGQDSKFLSVRWDARLGQMVLDDFAMNALCAAGTGSFLDQQAERLGLAIDGEFAEIALRSTTPARVAGRCTVFAKSDMIHHQQAGTPLADILLGLCHALARNYRGVVARGKTFTPPVLFQGGVSRNAAVVRAFGDVLRLPPGAIHVAVEGCFMPAIGAAWLARDTARAPRALADVLAPLARSLAEAPVARTRRLRPLPAPPPRVPAWVAGNGHGVVPAWIGVDVGSVSTNVVVVGEGGAVLARRYLPTRGAPLDAVRQGLLEVGAECAHRVAVRGVGVTGSGRRLTGHFVGADVVRNEITCHARGAVAVDPGVDTIFEIGGQDSKYVRLEAGAVVDFAMNNACAAGTGSFLEEQAARLRVDVERDLAPLALGSPAPVALGERCTVFMESDLVHHQQGGADVADLCGGLAHAVVENYLNRVVAGRPVGTRVFFQGGVASNASVAAALTAALGRPVTIPPHHDVIGAVGAALLAREEMDAHPGRATRFLGFDLRARTYAASVFVCRACENVCEVSRVRIAGERSLFQGARCDRFDAAGAAAPSALAGVPDLFAERAALLLGDDGEDAPRGGPRIAVPRVLTFFDLFPYWRTFLRELGAEVVLSAPTSPASVRASQELAVAEACFPVKLAYAHVAELQDSGADLLLLPAVLDRENTAAGQARNQYCPFIPALPYLLRENLRLAERGPRPLVFPLHLTSRRFRERDVRGLADAFGVSSRAMLRADAAGAEAQRHFHARLRARGAEVLAGLDGRRAAVVVGRPYNTCDPGACLDVPGRLRRMGVLPIPTDAVPVAPDAIPARYRDMYWRCGQDILAAATAVRRDPRLDAVYVTNFNCGPDSFLVSFFRNTVGRPFLELEIDDHTADAGLATRCEAFFESTRGGAA